MKASLPRPAHESHEHLSVTLETMSQVPSSKAQPQSSDRAVLLIDCPDQKGLVARVSGLLYAQGANILHADQHQDHELGLFFMRVEWALDSDAPSGRGAKLKTRIRRSLVPLRLWPKSCRCAGSCTSTNSATRRAFLLAISALHG